MWHSIILIVGVLLWKHNIQHEYLFHLSNTLVTGNRHILYSDLVFNFNRNGTSGNHFKRHKKESEKRCGAFNFAFHDTQGQTSEDQQMVRIPLLGRALFREAWITYKNNLYDGKMEWMCVCEEQLTTNRGMKYFSVTVIMFVMRLRNVKYISNYRNYSLK